MMRIPLTLWRAEWLKVRYRPFNQILLLLMNAFVIAFIGGVTLAALIRPGQFRAIAEQVAPFPLYLGVVAQVAALLGQIVAPVFVAQSIGSEYSGDTWKMIVPRHASRGAFVVIKLGIAIIGMLIALGSMTVVGMVVSGAASVLLGVSLAVAPGVLTISDFVFGVVVTIFPMLLYGSVALVATIAMRSALAGALISFFGLQTLALLSPFYGPLAVALPYPHLPNIVERWTFRDPATLSRITQELGGPVSPLISMGVVLLYCVLALIGATWLFAKRDIEGHID